MPETLGDRIVRAMNHSAARQYGRERVSELAHALQCAELAETGGADEELMLACLLHDVGRYAVDQALVADTLEPVARPAARPRGHHDIGADLLAPHVPARVAWLVRMHVDAKRWLCATEPGYYDMLSPGSQRTYVMQGGAMDPEEATRLAAHPWMADAVRLRRWDDQAKVPGKLTRSLPAWQPLLGRYCSEGTAR